MTETTASSTLVAAAPDEADWRDYFALLKPRVMSLVVLTGLVGLYLAPGPIHPVIAALAVICIAVGAGASGAINMWFDRDIDAAMARTCERPIPAGRVEPESALAFGVILAVFAVTLMGLTVNWAAGVLLALTIGFYVFVYTMWLKRRTPQNIVIGGAAGAFPPMIGWAAVTGDVGLGSLVLFLLIFIWTPPHFWALALYRDADYARAGVPMLPVVAGRRETKKQILVYTVLLTPLALAPVAIGLAGWLYGAVAAGLSLWFLLAAVAVWRTGDGDGESDGPAKRMFLISLAHLFGLFAALGADRALSGLL